MGILNVTPDSFSDGGQFSSYAKALERARQMVADGASIIDIGGESTRPGAAEVTQAEELERVIPLVEAITRELDVLVSVDTSKPQVICEAAAAGAHLINDVRALQEPGALEAAAQSGLPVCLMHMQGQPRTMQQQPSYRDLLVEIEEFFEQRIAACATAGISREKILLDPGFGFGKTLEHNYQLLGQLEYFHQLKCPLLVGMSRKSMVGNLLDRPVEERLAGSLGCAAIALLKGARIIRVHDVKETYDLLRVIETTRQYADEGIFSEGSF
ncbi:dihydropteroate synthase [Dongshaea marina]|uniref:dihydropteroate synthase n=1 Tax=Dongshaea marina TaxID=2047966 RepID=UPI000D3EC04C|nr:dihydropteroate synthase [Dongshaea marina]